MRESIKGTKLYVRNFGRGRSRITFIEPEELIEYDPIRIKGCAVVLISASVIPELAAFYQTADTRPKRGKVFPGGIGSSADESIKRFLRQLDE